MRRALARVAVAGGVLAVGLLGFTQTSVGRPFVSAMTRMAHGGCPFGYDKPQTPAQRERAQLNFATTHRGAERALGRPALGFVLDHSTRPEIAQQLAAHGVRCEAGKGASDLTCNGVPSSALGGVLAGSPPRNLWFTFGTKQQLLSVKAISRAAAAAPISVAFLATRATLDHEAGAATETHGNAEPQALAQGALHQASAEFRFRDYYALARATNLSQGFVLTEEYRSLPD